MRYYKQFHSWPLVCWGAGGLAALCLYFAYSLSDPEARMTLLACGLVGLIAAWVLRRGRKHYLEITNDRINHHGSKNWSLLKPEVTRVESGRKGWTDDYDLFLRIHARGREYPVDDAFLVNEERLDEIARAIQSRGSA